VCNIAFDPVFLIFLAIPLDQLLYFKED